MKKLTTVVAVTAVSALALGADPLLAQEVYETGAGEGEWGWIGLLGLIGLAGLAGRRRHRDVHEVHGGAARPVTR